jgi:hypothetical protein
MRKNKPTNVRKKMTCSLFFLPREGEVRIQKKSLGSGSNTRGQQIRVPGNSAFWSQDRDVRSQDEGQVN